MRLPMFSLMFSILGFASANAEDFPTITGHVMSLSQIENYGVTKGAAANSPVRGLKPLAPNLIKDFEGWVPGAYNDPLGYCTAGYGHLIAKKTCQQLDLKSAGKNLVPPLDFNQKLTISDGNALLDADTTPPRAMINQAVTVSLSDNQFGALTAFVFNVGEANFRKSTMLRLLNHKEYDLVAGQFDRWVLGDGKELPGLVQRRACEAALFRGDLKPGKDGSFSRANCLSKGIAPTAGPLIDIYKGEP